jgi:hypothetical protein
VKGISKSSHETECAAKFKTDLIKDLNELMGTVNCLFACPINPFGETAHNGMIMTYSVMGEALRLFNSNNIKKTKLTQNAKIYKVNLMVDGRKLKTLKLIIMKKLTELGSQSMG